MTNQSKGLIGLFRGQTECKKNRFGEPRCHVTNLGILGAGFMGAGIAQVSVDKGFRVFMKDTTLAGLDRGIGQVQSGLQTNVKKRKISRYMYKK